MPHNTNASITALLACAHGLLYRLFNGVELVVTSQNLCGAPLLILFKGNKVSHHLQQPHTVKHSPHQHFKFKTCCGRFCVAMNCAPHFEPFPIGSQRTSARIETVRDHQKLIEAKERWNLLFVRLQLFERVSNRRVFIHGILQFNHCNWQAV